MTRRVIARLFGGLGNQLFIYAAARSLAEKYNAALFLDTRSGFASDLYERQIALQHFKTKYREVSDAWGFKMPLGREIRYLSRNINRIIPYPARFHLSDFWESPKRYIRELDQNLISPVIWMEGYWQSPAYFESIRPVLVQEIKVQTPVSQQTDRLGYEISINNSVCIHLRMLRNFIKGVEQSTQNNLDIDYYLKSMDFIAQQVENPHFYCFSDNPEVLKSIIKTTHKVTMVVHNAGDQLAHEDFYLMSKCRHFILSNSTFGWWPAWLSEYPDKIVISPPLNYWDNLDILPNDWFTSDQLFKPDNNAV